MGFGTKCRKKFEKCFQKARFLGRPAIQGPALGWLGRGIPPWGKKKKNPDPGCRGESGGTFNPGGGGGVDLGWGGECEHTPRHFRCWEPANVHFSEKTVCLLPILGQAQKQQRIT